MKTIPIFRLCRRVSVAAGIILSGLLPALQADDFPSDLLPPPTGTLDATQIIMFGGQPVQIRDFSLRLPSTSIAPPAAGSSAIVSFSATMRARMSNNNGATFQSVSANADVTLHLTPSSDGSGCDAEVLSLFVSGGDLPPSVRLRESPTLQSTGRFTIVRCPDGSCRIGSFFDIFTELSLDSGQSWMPSTSATRCVCRAPSSENACATPRLLPPASAFRNPWRGTFSNGAMLRDLTISDPLTSADPPAPGASPVDVSSQVTCTGTVSLDGGVSFQPFACPASLVVRVTNQLDGTVTRTFDTEMLALSLSGGSLPGGVMLRESPSKASLGRTSLRLCPDGSCRISSFFDIFTELSLDGGVTWSPSSNGACPSAFGQDHFFSTDAFPVSADYACTTGELTTFGASGVVLRGQKIRLLPGTKQPLAAQGVDETREMPAQMTCDVSLDGGATFSRVVVDCATTASLTDLSSTSGAKSLEMLALSCTIPGGGSGNPAGTTGGVMLRESPTLASTGKVRVCTCPNSYMVSSFFDIFTEVSLDGGQSWLPASSPMHASLLPYVEQDNVFSSAYALPRDGSFETHPNDPPIPCAALTQSYLTRKMRVWLTSSDSVSNPLYEPKDHSVNPLFASCSCEISSDGGQTWTPVSGPATGSVSVSRVTHEDTWDSLSSFDTEMASFSVSLSSGGTTPVTVMLRESPTLQSTGQTTVKRLADGSACRMDSFFDVFTELSFDGGGTWSPAACAAHLELHASPRECAALSPRLPLATVLSAPDPEFKTIKRTGHVTIMKVSFDFSDAPAGVHTRVLPPAPGASVVCDSTVPVSFDYCPEGSTAYTRVECDAAVSCSYTCAADGSVSCEMLSCVFSGGSLPPELRVRESPTRQSLGRVMVRESPSGQLVSSFFDIFTEISIDGGTTYEPACSPLRVESRLAPRMLLSPLPAALSLARLSSQPISVRIDTGTMDFLYCPDGASPPARLHGDVFLRYEMKEVMVSSYCTSFDTEMLQMECSGLPAGMRLRESPTLPSKGRTCIYPQPDGSCRVSSFFDIFTELSLDGGKTWSALDLPLHYAFEDAVPSSNSPDNAWPPPGQFQRITGDPDFDLLYSNGRVMSFFDIFTEFSVGRPPLPSVGAPPLETTSTGRCHLHLAGTGEPVDQDCDVTFTTRLTATGTFSDGTTCFDTEMLSLSLSNSGLPPSVMVRESPTRQSLGQTRCRVSGGGGGSGGCAVDSFFDVFTELSLDGGSTWSPCDAPLRLAFTAPEISITDDHNAELASGSSSVAFSPTLTGKGVTRSFTLHNTGDADLTGLSFSIEGDGAADFSLLSQPPSVVSRRSSITFGFVYWTNSTVSRSVTLHVHSNDADEPSFDIALTARAFAPDADSDDDGLSDKEELALAGSGFDPLVSSGAETDFLRDNGFFRSSDMHALALGRPVLERNAATGHFHLHLGIRESPTLQSWSALTNFTPAFDAPTGTIDLDIPPGGSNKRFYQVLGQAP
jgi:hypothetical protein